MHGWQWEHLNEILALCEKNHFLCYVTIFTTTVYQQHLFCYHLILFISPLYLVSYNSYFSIHAIINSVPSGEPTNVTIQVLSSTSILLKWEPPLFSEQNGVISGYTILVTLLQDGSVQPHLTTGLSLQVEGDNEVKTMKCDNWVSSEEKGHDIML